MKTIGRRLLKLERSLALRVANCDDWGSLGSVRDELVGHAERLSESYGPLSERNWIRSGLPAYGSKSPEAFWPITGSSRAATRVLQRQWRECWASGRINWGC